jgi:hypothetical protein
MVAHEERVHLLALCNVGKPTPSYKDGASESWPQLPSAATGTVATTKVPVFAGAWMRCTAPGDDGNALEG